MTGPELTEPIRIVVERLVDAAPLSEVNWALTGSVGQRLQGVDVECRDVDVQTDEESAYELERRLGASVVQSVTFRRSSAVESHFGCLRFDDVDIDVEVMGALRKRLPDGRWTAQTDPMDHRVLVPLGQRRVPVLSLSYEAEAYEVLGRADRACLLRRAIAETH